MKKDNGTNIDETLCLRLIATIQRIAPGYASILSTLVHSRLSLGLCEAILLEPKKLFSMLKNIYGETTAKRVARIIIVEALVRAAKREDNTVIVNKVFEAFIEGDTSRITKLLGIAKFESIKSSRKAIPDIGKLFRCLIDIEEAVSKLYEDLADKYEGAQRLLLLYIARESRNHAEALHGISSLLGIKSSKCTDNTVLDTINELRAKITTREGAKEALSIMARLEEVIGEEEYMEIVAKSLIETLSSNDIKLLQELLRAIADDEEHHSKLVKAILEYTNN